MAEPTELEGPIVPANAPASVATADRLNAPAKGLAGATTAVAGLLALLGVNSERVWSLLDDTVVRLWITVAAVLAIVAIAASITVLSSVERPDRRRGAVLAVGAAAYILALFACLAAASAGANGAATLSFETVEVRPTDGGREVLVELSGTYLDQNESVTLEISVDVREEPILGTVLRPAGDGTLTSRTLMTLPADARRAVVKAWETGAGEPDCTSVARRGTCVLLAL